MNTQAILRYFHLHVHGDDQQKKEAEAMLLIFEEEARRDAEAEAKWADDMESMRRGLDDHTTCALPFPVALDILHNK